MKKKLMLVAIVLLSGVLLAGCTKKEEDEAVDQFENVTIVGEDDPVEGEDEEEVIVEDDEEVTDDPVDEEPEEEPEDEEPVEEDPVVTESGSVTVGTALVGDGASVVGYSYEVAGGKLMFEWKVRGSDAKPYPKLTASQLEDGTILAEFDSLVIDHVAKEETTTDLGTQLPDLTWMPDGDGSKYEFAFTSTKTFELRTDDRGEEGLWVILEISL